MMPRNLIMDAARAQNPRAYRVRPDLFPDYAENMGGGCVRLRRFVDTPGISWEVVYGEESGPVVCVFPRRSDHSPLEDDERGAVLILDDFVLARAALAVWESWAPADVPPVCAGCGVSVAPESGVLVHELWAEMTGELVCRSCWESTGECDTCGGGTNWSDNGTCATCQRGLGGAE